jgi:hypothetical protein
VLRTVVLLQLVCLGACGGFGDTSEVIADSANYLTGLQKELAGPDGERLKQASERLLESMSFQSYLLETQRFNVELPALAEALDEPDNHPDAAATADVDAPIALYEEVIIKSLNASSENCQITFLNAAKVTRTLASPAKFCALGHLAGHSASLVLGKNQAADPKCAGREDCDQEIVVESIFDLRPLFPGSRVSALSEHMLDPPEQMGTLNIERHCLFEITPPSGQSWVETVACKQGQGADENDTFSAPNIEAAKRLTRERIERLAKPLDLDGVSLKMAGKMAPLLAFEVDFDAPLCVELTLAAITSQALLKAGRSCQRHSEVNPLKRPVDGSELLARAMRTKDVAGKLLGSWRTARREARAIYKAAAEKLAIVRPLTRPHSEDRFAAALIAAEATSLAGLDSGSDTAINRVVLLCPAGLNCAEAWSSAKRFVEQAERHQISASIRYIPSALGDAGDSDEPLIAAAVLNLSPKSHQRVARIYANSDMAELHQRTFAGLDCSNNAGANLCLVQNDRANLLEYSKRLRQLGQDLAMPQAGHILFLNGRRIEARGSYPILRALKAGWLELQSLAKTEEADRAEGQPSLAPELEAFVTYAKSFRAEDAERLARADLSVNDCIRHSFLSDSTLGPAHALPAALNQCMVLGTGLTRATAKRFVRRRFSDLSIGSGSWSFED